ncbi:MAG: MOSC domain-containing protein [Actinomycetota bacterium]
MTARVVSVHVWPPGLDPPQRVDQLVLNWGGPVGDRHHGLTMRSDVRQKEVFSRGTEIRNHRQLSIVDAGELAEIAVALGLPELSPGTIADNICTEGIDNLTQLPALSRLVFEGGAVILVGGENLPCTIAGGLVEGRYGTRPEAFPKAAMGLRGVTGWVERPGTIRPGTPVTVVPPTGM